MTFQCPLTFIFHEDLFRTINRNCSPLGFCDLLCSGVSLPLWLLPVLRHNERSAKRGTLSLSPPLMPSTYPYAWYMAGVQLGFIWTVSLLSTQAQNQAFSLILSPFPDPCQPILLPVCCSFITLHLPFYFPILSAAIFVWVPSCI